jgi:NAD(P) transhydrogenase subunit alpha
VLHRRPVKVGIPKEIHAGERRVAGTPHTVQQLVKMGMSVMVEAGAGVGASLPDALYTAEGAELVDATTLWAEADLVLKVRPPTPDEARQLKRGGHLISFFWPAQNKALIDILAERSATVHRHGLHPAHQPGAEDGRAQLDGQHRRATAR